MANFINTIIGDLNEKKEYRETEKRAKALPAEYSKAYKEIKKYIFGTSGILTVQPLRTLVELLEEATANQQSVTEVLGTDVAGFADELVKGEKNWIDAQKERLNNKLS